MGAAQYDWRKVSPAQATGGTATPQTAVAGRPAGAPAQDRMPQLAKGPGAQWHGLLALVCRKGELLSDAAFFRRNNLRSSEELRQRPGRRELVEEGQTWVSTCARERSRPGPEDLESGLASTRGCIPLCPGISSGALRGLASSEGPPWLQGREVLDVALAAGRDRARELLRLGPETSEELASTRSSTSLPRALSSDAVRELESSNSGPSQNTTTGVCKRQL